MIEIKYNDMELLDDSKTVKIIGDYKQKEIIIKLSILQLAKVFNSDKDVLKELNETTWGSTKLEDKCDETKDLVEKFPDVDIKNNEVKVEYISLKPKSKKNSFLNIYGEDLCGWRNEGINIRFPKRFYNKELKDKDFYFILKQDSIILYCVD